MKIDPTRDYILTTINYTANGIADVISDMVQVIAVGEGVCGINVGDTVLIKPQESDKVDGMYLTHSDNVLAVVDETD